MAAPAAHLAEPRTDSSPAPVLESANLQLSNAIRNPKCHKLALSFSRTMTKEVYKSTKASNYKTDSVITFNKDVERAIDLNYELTIRCQSIVYSLDISPDSTRVAVGLLY